MYLDRIIKKVAPITSTVYDQVAMSFPIPTRRGCCVLYYTIKEKAPNGMNRIDLLTVALVNADSVRQIKANEIFSEGFILSLQRNDTNAGFEQVFQQRECCKNAIEAMIHNTNYETVGFIALKNVSKYIIQHFVSEVNIYASLLGLQSMYTELLKDLTELI